MRTRSGTRRLLAALAVVTLLPFALAFLYAAVAFALVLFPANPDAPAATPSDAIDAYVIAYGAHTDVVLPVASSAIDWKAQFPPTDFQGVPADAAYVAIGWGDREFYLNTPEWKDLTVGRAAGALLGLHGTLLHVTYLRKADFADYAHGLPLTSQQYTRLVRYILAAAPRRDGRMISLPGVHMGPRDAFYEAYGSYTMFQTCNSWIGQGLREAGVKVSRWTPFDTLVVWHLQQNPQTANPARR